MNRPHPPTLLFLQHRGQIIETSVRFNNFADGDTHCAIEDAASVKGAAVLLRHYLYPNQNEQLVRLLFLVGTLVDLGAKSIEVFVPYLPYARQDKAHVPGEAVSSRLLCRFLRTGGVHTLYTIDCHFMKGALATEIEGLTIHNILVQDRLIAALKELTGKPYTIIGPDEGASYLAQAGTIKKARAATYGQAADGSIHRAIETLEDRHLALIAKTLVIADDMVSTGATMVQALEAVRARSISKVYAMTTHGLFLYDSLEKIAGLTRGVVYSDTIPRDGSVPIVEEAFAAVVAQMPVNVSSASLLKRQSSSRH